MLNNMFSSYMASCQELDDPEEQGQGGYRKALSCVSEYLQSSDDHSSCLVCLGAIQASEAAWQCDAGCYTLLHLTCIQEWIKSQVDDAACSSLTICCHYSSSEM